MGFVPLDMNAEPISEYPTLAIQVGFAQTIESLREEAESFLKDSRGEIKIVLLVKFEYRADAFDLPAASWIEAWRRNDAGGVYKASSVVNISNNQVNIKVC